ncbi:hypothetical protein HISP_17890 (plasmid) [Haloarcula hispanica N601]|uniref:Uncharacterized protein n=2 Tax=Haloarcula hispanica TaxID=51589 RepID=V5TRJ5_HALHI|nr:hypothetical protein [Haloarcula hispanica]AEM58854.1 conserved hypothetical protein [Haloarcula hispanica ATCC 33960]AHB67936.1 hypothetical protein HISP_17890 [Haloarcula hispanica N601]
MQSGIAGEIVKEVVERVVGELSSAITAGISGFFAQLKTQIINYLDGFFQAIIDPMVRTPAPEGPNSAAPVDIAFESASNVPWDSLISGIYFEGVVGLALGLQFIVLAMIGLRYGSMNPIIRKKLLRRLGVAFLSLFFWLPVASLGTQFFDAIGNVIYRSGQSKEEIAALISSAQQIADLSLGIFVVLMIVGLYVYLKAAFIFITRWLLVFLLTLSMPLVATFWAVEVWPLNRFSGLAKQVAGAYPGVLAAGIPPAILIRMSFEATNWGLPSKLSLFISLVTLYLAAKSQKVLIQRSSRVAIQVSEQALAGGKKPLKIGAAAGGAAATAGAGAVGGPGAAMATGGTIRAASGAAKGRVGSAATGAQMVHRQMAANPAGMKRGSSGGPTGSGGGSSPTGSGGGGNSGSGGGGSGGSAPPSGGGSGSSGSGGSGGSPPSGGGSGSGSPLNSRFTNGGSSGSSGDSKSDDTPISELQTKMEQQTKMERQTQINSGDTRVYESDSDPPFSDGKPDENGTDTDSGGSESYDSLKDVFATDDDILGPDVYRDGLPHKEDDD